MKLKWYLAKSQDPFNFNQEMVYSGYIHERGKGYHKVAKKKSAQVICDMLNESIEKDKRIAELENFVLGFSMLDFSVEDSEGASNLLDTMQCKAKSLLANEASQDD